MKKIATILVLAVLLSGAAPALAEDSQNPAGTKALAAKAPGDTVFNRLSNFLSGFDKTYARRGNKQGFWDATADWMRGINK